MQVSLAPTHVSPSVGPSIHKWHFWISIAPEHFFATVAFDDPPPQKKEEERERMYMKA